MAAFIHHNGPVSAGINANVFGLREKGCEKTGGACCVHVEPSCEINRRQDHPKRVQPVNSSADCQE